MRILFVGVYVCLSVSICIDSIHLIHISHNILKTDSHSVTSYRVWIVVCNIPLNDDAKMCYFILNFIWQQGVKFNPFGPVSVINIYLSVCGSTWEYIYVCINIYIRTYIHIHNYIHILPMLYLFITLFKMFIVRCFHPSVFWTANVL